MKIIKFASLICLWFIFGFLLTGAMQDYEAGCPFDAGGNNANVPGTLTVTGALSAGSVNAPCTIDSSRLKLNDDVEFQVGNGGDLCIGYDSSRDHISISDGNDCNANKLFEATSSSVAIRALFYPYSAGSAPTSADEGAMYYDTGANVLYIATAAVTATMNS